MSIVWIVPRFNFLLSPLRESSYSSPSARTSCCRRTSPGTWRIAWRSTAARPTSTLRAIPAVRLLAKRGDLIKVRGSGLEYEFEDPDQDAFERLDGFEEVDIELKEVTAGPFDTERFVLKRDGSGTRYAVDIDASATAQDLAQAAGERFGNLGKLLGELAGGALPFSAVEVSIRVQGELEADDGRVRMVSGTGSVAGIPAGPLTSLITNAVLSRL